MSLQTLLIQTATITPRVRSGVDEYNNPAIVPGTPTDVPCRLELLDTGENVYGQDRTLTNYRLYLLPDVQIDSESKVTIDGVDYEVDGDPAVQYDGVGPHHIECKVRRIRG